jgi:RHS repeat-associated protein
MRKSGTTTFGLSDLIGTTTRQTNAAGSVTATRVYDAFGNVTSSTGTFSGPLGYVGGQRYQEDGDSGLKLLGHRYDDPSTGRYLTRDHELAGRNWYVYANSHPTTTVDPNGEEGWDFPTIVRAIYVAWYLYLTGGGYPIPPIETPPPYHGPPVIKPMDPPTYQVPEKEPPEFPQKRPGSEEGSPSEEIAADATAEEQVGTATGEIVNGAEVVAEGAEVAEGAVAVAEGGVTLIEVVEVVAIIIIL